MRDDYNIIAFSDSREALKFITETPPDIAVLDIDMPEISGFDLAGALQTANKDSIAVFISNYDQLVYTSIKYKPFRFVRKEYISKELPEALSAIIDEFTVNSKFFEICSNSYNQTVYVSNIISIESQKNYVQFNCTNGSYLYRSTVAQMEKELEKYGFARIHAAFIVNMKYVIKYNPDFVVMKDGSQYKISKRFLNDFRDKYTEYIRR